MSLQFGAELWKWDEALYESAAAIRSALARGGRAPDSSDVLHEATSRLLPDVVDAAGGVERSAIRLHGAVEQAQEAIDAANSTGEPEPPHGRFLAHPATEEAWYSLEELFVWTRTVDDRLRRKATDGRNFPDQGLIPALEDGPRRDAVIEARNRLLMSGLQEARYLSGLNLHMQPIPGGSRMGRIRAGRVTLPFPDRVRQPIAHRLELTYNEGRDGIAVADRLMQSVAQFMEEVLEAFETHIPDRFRR